MNTSLIEFFEGLSDEEIKEFANKLLAGYRPCPRCGNLCDRTYKTPQRVKTSLARFSLFEPSIPGKMCAYCISEGITKYNKVKREKEEKENRERQGYIETDRFSIDSRQGDKGGFVYLAQHTKNIYKIGASVNPINRLSGLGYKSHQFVLALKTLYHFDLEKYLHQKFQPQRQKGELFQLNQDDIAFIKNIKTLRVTYLHNPKGEYMINGYCQVDEEIKCYDNLADLEHYVFG